MVAYRHIRVAVALGAVFFSIASPTYAQFEVPPPTPPVLIVPGLVESHNKNRILYDEPGGTWKFTPTIGSMFEPLITRLKNEGYVEGVDLFVVHYDWRQRNSLSATEYLNPAIDHAKAISGSGQVDIVAHSMGGLVARSYIQGSSYENDVRELIMLGTPNAGASGAYLVWEGGILPNSWGFGQELWIKRIERSLKKVRDQELERPLSFRSFFPSIKELLPIDPYIVRGGTSLVPSVLTEANAFLQNLRATASLLDERVVHITTIAGSDIATLGTVPISTNRTDDDMNNFRWRDGHADPDPSVEDSLEGDGTVLTHSAGDIGSENVVISGAKHTELPAKGQDDVVRFLKGESNSADYISPHLARAAIGVDVFSPVMPVITGPNGEILSFDINTFSDAEFDWDEDTPDHVKMLTITDPVPGTYTVTLNGIGEGPYTVVISHASDSNEITEEEFTGQAAVGSTATYTFTVGDGGESISIMNPKSGGPAPEGGRGDETDCCPGHDETVSKKALKGKVLGATMKHVKLKKGPVTLEELQPLNDIFFSVYKRMPTFAEWEYWVKRYTKDKRDWEKIRGAMAWHKERQSPQRLGF